MAALSGNLLLLKVGNGGSPETFATVGGLRATSISVANALVDITTKDSNHYRTILGGGGVRSISISAGGVFTDAASEELIRSQAMANTLNNYELELPNGDSITGSFLITQYERNGANDDSEQYSITLESSGQWTFTAA